MEVVKRWLAGSQNFIVGKLYFKQFGKDKNLTELFDKGETPFAKQQLKQALEALLLHKEKEPDITTAKLAGIMPQGTDDIAAALEKEWRPLYQRMKFLCHEIDKYGTDNSATVREQCRLICMEILEIEQRCMQLWEKLDHYRVHKQLPEVKTNETLEIPTDPVELALLIQALKKNIRRNKLKAKKPGDKQAYYLGLVKKYEEQLKLINPK